LNAAAVKWSIDRVMKLDLDPSWLVSAFVERVEVVDTYTVKFVLKEPVSFFPALVATTPYTPVSPKSFPEDKVAEPTVGHYGPYRIKKWTRDENGQGMCNLFWKLTQIITAHHQNPGFLW